MGLVGVVNGFGTEINRSVTRPYGYGRGLMQVDPASYPFTSGRYIPVRVSLDRTAAMGLDDTTIDIPMPNWPDDWDSRISPNLTQPPNGVPQEESSWGVVEDEGKRFLWNFATGERRPYSRALADDLLPKRYSRPSSVAAGKSGEKKPSTPSPMTVPNPNPSGLTINPKPGATGPLEDPLANLFPGQQINPDTWKEAPPKHPGEAAGKGFGKAVGTTASAAAAAARDERNNRPALTGNIAMDTAAANRARDAAIGQYIDSKSGNWKISPTGRPFSPFLGITTGQEGISRWDALAQMTQVSVKPAQENPVGSYYWLRGIKTPEKLVAQLPTFTARSAANSYYMLGLYQKDKQADVINWKRFFDSMGFYRSEDWVNTGSLTWSAAENYAMAKFMAVANNSGPQFNQDPNGLYRLREQMLNGAISNAGGSGAGGGAGGGRSFPYTQTQTSTSVNLSNLEDARETLRGYLSDMIGRAPSDGEVKSFLGRLNSYERAHPTTTTTTTTFTDENTSNMVVSGPREDNIDPYNMTKQFVEGGSLAPDYRAYQQLRYYSAINDILANPAGIANIQAAG